MNTNPGLKFIIIIAVTLCAAIALRVFASGKRYHEPQGPFQLVIVDRTEMKKGTKKETAQKLLKDGINCDMNFKEKSDSVLDTLCGPATTAKRTENLTHASGPHIQQRVQFTKVSDLKALVAALATPTPSARPEPSTAVPEGSASPAPHVAQRVESNTPQAASAIAKALKR